ncbi:hypothetical protein JL720_8006 [Aureococcus anophagefferens]|nr:hypothetical protein JL720_8006 [Aureococcus anophagefferens]
MARPARAAKPTDLTEKDAAPLGSDDDAASSNGKGDDDDDDASVVESAAAAPAKAEAPRSARASRRPGGGDLVAAAPSRRGRLAPRRAGPAAALAAVPEEFDALLAKRSARAAARRPRRRRARGAPRPRAAPRGPGGARVEVWACGAGGCARRYAFRADALDVRWVRGAPAPGALGVLVALTNDGAVEARALPAATTGRLHRIPAAWRFAAPGRRATCVRLSPLAPARAAAGFDDGSCAVADLSPDGAAEALVVLAGAPRRDRPAATGAAVWSLRDAAFPLWEDRFSDRCGSLGLAWHPSGACLLSGGAVPGNFSGAVLRLDVSKAPDEKRRSTVAYRHAKGTAVLDLDALLVPAAGGDRVELVLAAEAAAPPAAAEAAADGGTVDGAVLAALRAAEAARAATTRPRRRRRAPADDPGPLDDRDVAVCSARLGAGDALGYVVSAAACGLLRLQKVTGEPGDDETVDEPEPEPPKKPKAKEAPKKPRGRPKKAEDAAGDGDAAPKKPRGRPKKAAAPPPPPDEEDEDLVCKPKRRSAPAAREEAAPAEAAPGENDAPPAEEDAPPAKKRGRPRKQGGDPPAVVENMPPPPADDDDAPPAADAPPNKRKRGVPAKVAL